MVAYTLIGAAKIFAIGETIWIPLLAANLILFLAVFGKVSLAYICLRPDRLEARSFVGRTTTYPYSSVQRIEYFNNGIIFRFRNRRRVKVFWGDVTVNEVVAFLGRKAPTADAVWMKKSLFTMWESTIPYRFEPTSLTELKLSSKGSIEAEGKQKRAEKS